MSATLAELDIVIGCPEVDRHWIPDTALGWGSNFILSGMNVGSKRRAWRFTPKLPLQVGTSTVLYYVVSIGLVIDLLHVPLCLFALSFPCVPETTPHLLTAQCCCG